MSILSNDRQAYWETASIREESSAFFEAKKCQRYNWKERNAGDRGDAGTAVAWK